MSLKNKLDETKLRSLGYNSNEPYVVIDVKDQSFNKQNNSLSDAAFNLLGNNLNLRNTRLGAAAIDTLRISRFLTDPKEGPQFITKQIGLQLMNPVSNFGHGPKSNRIYSPLNTITQVAASGIGGHLNRTGLNPIINQISDLIIDSDTYEHIKYKETDNPLVKFREKLVPYELLNSEYVSPNIDRNNLVFKLKQSKFGNNISNIIGLFPNPLETIYEYLGGPESLMGIGITNIKRYDNTLNDIYKNEGKTLRGFNPYFNKSKLKYNNGIINGTEINYSTLYGVSLKGTELYPELEQIINNDYIENVEPIYLKQTGSYVPSTLFKSFKEAKSYSQNPDTPYNYASNKQSLPSDNKNIIYTNTDGKTVTIKGNWYNNSRDVRISGGNQDQINLTPLFIANEGQNDYVNIGGKHHNIRDLIKFRIETILGKGNGDDTKSTWMIFRAYLTDLSDNMNAEWSDIKYVNRSEKLFVYNGFSRSINIGFKVAALSKAEMKPMYQKLNYLMSGLAGHYKEGILEGTFSRVTVGNYIDRQHGIITSLNYKISNETPWEIALDEPEGGDKVLILPHIIEVSLSFTPIGINNKGKNELPGRSEENGLSFIGQNDNNDQIDYSSGNIKLGNFETSKQYVE